MDLESQHVEYEEIHTFRKEIDANIKKAQELQNKLGRSSGGREISLVVTKLQEAKMWAGKILEALGSEFPEQYRDEAGK